MGKLLGDVNQVLQAKAAQAIHPVPAVDPTQRGPSCGFYGLAYVLKYWHERFLLHGGDYKIQEPLKARTHNAEPKTLSDVERATRKQDKLAAASQKPVGHFTSLRHFGKFQKLTDYGSVFNAEHLVKVAQGENSQYAGQFDGEVVTVTTDTFPTVVKALLDIGCPVLCPYDVSVDAQTLGEPANNSGRSAHWVALIGWYREGLDDQAVFYNWGGFYVGSLQGFAVSNAQLTSNEYLPMQKFERRNPHTGQIVQRDYKRVDQNYDKTFQAQGWQVRKIGGVVQNAEFNDPSEGGQTAGKWDTQDQRHRLLVSGLRNKLVVVYRAEDKADIAKALAAV
jgi:hypothetical protein